MLKIKNYLFFLSLLVVAFKHINIFDVYSESALIDSTLKNAFQQNIISILTNKLNKFQSQQPNCNVSDILYLQALLTTACTNAQTNETVRTLCENCFVAATSNPSTTTLLTNLLPCAMLYLNNTPYTSCIDPLQNASLNNSVQIDPVTSCPTGYCPFVQCIRRVNANTLINMCYVNSMAGNNLSTAAGRTNHYLLTTSCVLAMVRCNQINPISGVPQNNGSQLLVYNSLQVTRNGDLRIITTTRTPDQQAVGFCLSDTSLEQSGWGTISC